MGSVFNERDLRRIAKSGIPLVPRESAELDVNKLVNFLNSLIITARTPGITVPHRTALCNVLSTTILRCSDSTDERADGLLWNGGYWLQTVDVVIDTYGDGNPKPMRQLMGALSRALERCKESDHPKKSLCDRLQFVFKDGNAAAPVKAGMQILIYFLDRRTLSFSDVEASLIRMEGWSRHYNSQEYLSHMIHAIFRLIEYDDLLPAIGELMSTLIESYKTQVKADQSMADQDSSDVTAAWTKTVLRHMRAFPDSTDAFRHYILPRLFNNNFPLFASFLQEMHLERLTAPGQNHSEEEQRPLLCALMVGHTFGWIEPRDEFIEVDVMQDSQRIRMPTVWLGHLLSQQSQDARLAALQLLVTSKASTKPLSFWSLTLLKRTLPDLHTDTDANFRSELFSVIQRLFDRIRSVLAVLGRSGDIADPTELRTCESGGPFEDHLSFVREYLKSLTFELRSTASYQRHICALKCLTIVCRSGLDRSVANRHLSKSAVNQGHWPVSINVLSHSVKLLLVDLLLDPFDDVRAEAAILLKIAASPVDQGGLDNKTFAQTFRERLEAASDLSKRSGRADQADGVAHMYTITFESAASNPLTPIQPSKVSQIAVFKSLVNEVETTLQLFKDNMSQAVATSPLHGHLSSIRYILDQPGFYASVVHTEDSQAWREVHQQVVRCIQRIWTAVRPVLCNDAPEGHMPNDLDDQESSLTTKDLLSYSWRALKESSLVLRILIVKASADLSDTRMIALDDLKNLGELLNTQLIELRHRGAFSTVAQSFFACCSRFSRGPKDLQNMLRIWYRDLRETIRHTETINTRRSAGLPSLVVGLVAPESSPISLISTVDDLTFIAQEPLEDTPEQSESLGQVHALNCLKDIFKNSRLAERSEPLIGSTLSLASDCLSSPSWGIRNAGLMLFRALLDRLLGTNDSYADEDTPPQSHTSLTKIPNLIDIILRLLHAPANQRSPESSAAQHVFPALQLLQRAPSKLERLRELQDAVFKLMGSPHWHVRDKAASTYAALSPPDELDVSFEELIQHPCGNQNALHGALLCARYMSKRMHLTSTRCVEVHELLIAAAESLYWQNNCPITRAAYLDLVVEIARAQRHNQSPQQSEGSNSFHHENLPVALRELSKISKVSGTVQALLLRSLASLLVYQEMHTGNVGVETLLINKLDDGALLIAVLDEAQRALVQEEFCEAPLYLSLTRVCKTVLAQIANEKLRASPDLEIAAVNWLLVVVEVPASKLPAVRAILQDQDALSIRVMCMGSSPLAQDRLLVLSGALIALSLNNSTSDPSESQSLEGQPSDAWVKGLHSALLEDNSLDTRMAAVESARIFVKLTCKTTLSSLPRQTSLNFYLALYDLTNDDDDDIRNSAASIIGRLPIFNSGQIQKGPEERPLVAAQNLVRFLTARYCCEKHLVRQGLKRMTDGAIRLTKTASVQEIFQSETKGDSALFAEEKQNLYIDPALEARTWCDGLMKLSASAFTTEILHELETWVVEGLESLISRIHASAEGQCGWTRMSSLFALGLQLIYGSRILLRLHKKGVLADASGQKIAELLVELCDSVSKNDTNVLWANEINSVEESY